MSNPKPDEPLFTIRVSSTRHEHRGLFPPQVSIPLRLNARAERNHGGQGLARLEARGGLSPCEALAIMEDRPWRSMETQELIDDFTRHGWSVLPAQ